MRPEEIRGNVPIKKEKKRMWRPPLEGISFYKNVNVRIRKDVYEFLEDYIRGSGINKWQFIRLVLDEWILNYKKNQNGWSKS